MEIRKTDGFLDDLAKLPADAKRIFRKQEAIFAQSWLDSRLHLKRIKELKGVYSFRVTRRYRALFYLRNGEAVFFSIGHRKEIYKR